MSDILEVVQPVASSEQIIQPEQLPKPPAPNATGNAKISVLKHALVDAFFDPQDSGRKSPAGVDLAISNVSNTTIATAVFETLFYDDAGNILETVKQKESDLLPDTSRAILINSSQFECGKVASYDVRLVRTTTTDVEKVQLRRHETQTTETGEEAVHGIVQNISSVKTDAAVVVTFYDPNKENIGTKVVILKDIEPDAIRQYDLRFKPLDGDTVAGYNIVIGEIAG